MPVAYPPTLPLPLFEKTREQPAAFQIAKPRRGYGYVEPTGTDTPVFWSLMWRLTGAQAQLFRQWFIYTTERGTLTFSMDIQTEFGLETHECQFLPEGLLPAKRIGYDVWEYSASVMTRALSVPLYDPLFANVVLLLHGEGSNGSTVFTDSSSYARSVTRVLSNATISTSQAKFGSASIGGTGADRLTMSFGAEFTGSDWCIETWVRPNLAGSVYDYFGIFRIGGALFNGFLDGTGNGGTGKFMFALGGPTLISSPSSMVTNTWQHIAIACEGGTTDAIRMFVDGVLAGTHTGTGVGALPGATTMTIGQAPSGFNGIYGHIDEYRVTVGDPRYTAAFTPPTTAFPDR